MATLPRFIRVTQIVSILPVWQVEQAEIAQHAALVHAAISSECQALSLPYSAVYTEELSIDMLHNPAPLPGSFYDGMPYNGPVDEYQCLAQ